MVSESRSIQLFFTYSCKRKDPPQHFRIQHGVLDGRLEHSIRVDSTDIVPAKLKSLSQSSPTNKHILCNSEDRSSSFSTATSRPPQLSGVYSVISFEVNPLPIVLTKFLYRISFTERPKIVHR